MSTQIQCGSHQIHTVCNEYRSAKIKYKTKRNTRETAQRIRHTSVRFELHAPIYERKTKRSNAVFIEMRRTVSHFFRFVGNAVSLKIEWMRICLRFYRSRSQQALNGVGNWTERTRKKSNIVTWYTIYALGTEYKSVWHALNSYGLPAVLSSSWGSHFTRKPIKFSVLQIHGLVHLVIIVFSH